MPDGLYERDTLAWAEQQSKLLRRFAAGEDVGAAIDWTNVVEEVEDVGLYELDTCEIALRQAMTNLLKRRAWPKSERAEQWRERATEALDQAADYFAPYMQSRLMLADLYADALKLARQSRIEPRPQADLPNANPFTLDALLTGDVDSLQATLQAVT